MEDRMSLLTPPIRPDRVPLQDLLPLRQPLRIFIDPCDVCNFDCSFCFYHYDKTFRGAFMEKSLLYEIIEQLKEFEAPINVIHLYGLGEPLLHQDLPDFIRAVRENQVAKEIAVTSNGSKLSHTLSERMVEAGLGRLSISLNGIEDRHFENIVGKQVNFSALYEQIQFFYQIRKQCHLHVKINGECFSEEEREKFIHLFEPCSDSFNIDHTVDIWPGIDLTGSSSQAIYGGEPLSENPPCPQMFYELMIHSDGSVSPCCADYTYQTENLGNVKDRTVKQIWDSGLLRQMRIQTLKGVKNSYKICNKCSYPICASSVNISPYKKELIPRFSGE